MPRNSHKHISFLLDESGHSYTIAAGICQVRPKRCSEGFFRPPVSTYDHGRHLLEPCGENSCPCSERTCPSPVGCTWPSTEDSRKGLGSHVDRHEHIGRGEIGLNAFRLLLNDPRFSDHPMVLETPKGKDLREDRENLAVLRSLIESGDLF